MKKLLLPLIYLGICYASLAQEVIPTQQTLITKISATWCINCGTWGWETQEKILAENAGVAPDFPEFPWLNDLIDPNNCCDNRSIQVYNSGIYQFVYIEGEASCSSNSGTLYFQDGTFYCSDADGLDCRAAYQLSEQDIAKSWTCSGTMTNTDTEVDSKQPSFESFPWLNDLIEVDACCNNQRVIAYYSSIYTFIFIEKDDVCGNTVSQLYFQDGTFYCNDANGMDCRAAYGLKEDQSSVIWECNGLTSIPEMDIPEEEVIETENPVDTSPIAETEDILPEQDRAPLKYLALGDSYTIGQGVVSTQNYPTQLVAQLQADEINITAPTIIARTGWTTGDLQRAINQQSLSDDYDLVTLLIGVNNQFQGHPQEEYTREFEILLQQAIQFAKGKAEKVIVLSIPDYAFTPFGQRFNPTRISQEIDIYNSINKSITDNYGVSYFDITDISRNGLADPSLVASDRLHPSAEQYRQWIDRIYSTVLGKLK